MKRDERPGEDDDGAEAYDTVLVRGVEPRRMRAALNVAFLAALCAMMMVEPRSPWLTLGAAVAGLAFIAALRTIWRRFARAPIRVDPTHVSHAGVRLTRSSLRIELHPWIVEGHVGTIARLTADGGRLTIGARGYLLPPEAHRGAPCGGFVDAQLRDAGALDRLLRAVGHAVPSEERAEEAPYRSGSSPPDQRSRTMLATRRSGDELGIEHILSFAVITALAPNLIRYLGSAFGLGDESILAFAGVLLLLNAARQLRDPVAAVSAVTLRVVGTNVYLENAGATLWTTGDAPRQARLRHERGRTVLELARARGVVRFVRAQPVAGIARGDFVLGATDFDWLVKRLWPAAVQPPAAVARARVRAPERSDPIPDEPAAAVPPTRVAVPEASEPFPDERARSRRASKRGA